MTAEPQRLVDAATVQGDTVRDGQSAPKHLSAEARPESRIQNLTLVLERLWLFYEAMHHERPCVDGDEALADLGKALKGAARASRDA